MWSLVVPLLLKALAWVLVLCSVRRGAGSITVSADHDDADRQDPCGRIHQHSSPRPRVLSAAPDRRRRGCRRRSLTASHGRPVADLHLELHHITAAIIPNTTFTTAPGGRITRRPAAVREEVAATMRGRVEWESTRRRQTLRRGRLASLLR